MKYVSNERGALPVLVAILVVALVAVVGMAVNNANKSRQKAAQTASASPSPASSTEATSSPEATSSLSTYTSPEEGASFKYPSDWKLSEKSVTDPDGRKRHLVELTSPSTYQGRPFSLLWVYNDRPTGDNPCTAQQLEPLKVPGYPSTLSIMRCGINSDGRTNYLHLANGYFTVGQRTSNRMFGSAKTGPVSISWSGSFAGEGEPLGLSLADFNNRPEVQAAVSIIKSLHY